MAESGGFLRGAHGSWGPGDAPLATGDEVASIAAHRFHAAAIDLARTGLEHFDASERYFQASMLAVPVGVAEQVRHELCTVMKRIVGMVEDARVREGLPVEQVMLCNMQLLPVSDRMPVEDDRSE